MYYQRSLKLTWALTVHGTLRWVPTNWYRLTAHLQSKWRNIQLKYFNMFYKKKQLSQNKEMECIQYDWFLKITYKICFYLLSSVAQSCPTICDPMNDSTPGLPVHHQLPEFTQTHLHRVGDAIQPSHPQCPLFLLPPIPPGIRVFSNESTLRMRWPKY